MDFGIDLAQLREGLIYYLFLVAAVCIHEWAHAFAADRLGDDTPAMQGRVTLNPIAHMDLLGTVIFPLLFIFVLPGGFFLAWGKPVMVNTSNFANRVRGDIITTLAGPFANLGLALLAAVVGGFACRFDPNLEILVQKFLILNVMLAVFNLIPLPPLDGGQVMRHVVGMSEETFLNLSRWSFLILLVALQIGPVRMVLGVVMGVVALPFSFIFNQIAG